MKKKFIALAALPLLAACGQVDTGYRGVFVNLGKPVEQVGEGLHWYNIFTTSLVEVDVSTKKWPSSTEVYTKDVQQATVKFSLTYSLDPSKAMVTYSRFPNGDWFEAQVPQVVEQSIKDVFGQSEAVKDAINNRPAVQARIRREITDRLKAKNILVHGFELNDIVFSDAFEQAVEAKQVAVERANAAKNKTVQVQEEARQKIIQAEAEAEAMRIKANALAQNPALVQYEAVQAWDGKLPQNMYGNAVPFIQVK